VHAVDFSSVLAVQNCLKAFKRLKTTTRAGVRVSSPVVVSFEEGKKGKKQTSLHTQTSLPGGMVRTQQLPAKG